MATLFPDSGPFPKRDDSKSVQKRSASVAFAKQLIPYVAGVAIAGAGIACAVHERESAQAAAVQKQSLAAENAHMTSELSATRVELNALTAKVNAMAAAGEAAAKQNAARTASAKTAQAKTAAGKRPAGHRAGATDARYTKLQTELDAQGREIEQTRSDLENTRGDLSRAQTELTGSIASARTELTGAIARTHDELMVLEKKGERKYFEFDIAKAKEFKREGPVGISLRKANTKREYADLMLQVEDRNLSQKHVNLYQPAMFYLPDSGQPVEIVINDISKDRIHGYVSAPKYRKSELMAMANSGGGGPVANSAQGDGDIVGAGQAANAQTAPRKKLTLPADQPAEE